MLASAGVSVRITLPSISHWMLSGVQLTVYVWKVVCGDDTDTHVARS